MGTAERDQGEVGATANLGSVRADIWVWAVRIGGFDHILQVKQLLERRVSYPLARLAYEDLTPERLPKLYLPSLPRREAGSGRPTKKERRQLDRLRGRSPNQGRR